MIQTYRREGELASARCVGVHVFIISKPLTRGMLMNVGHSHADLYAAGVQSLAHAEKNLEFRCVLDPNGRLKAIEVTGKGGGFVKGASRIDAREWAAVWDAARWAGSGRLCVAVGVPANNETRKAYL